MKGERTPPPPPPPTPPPHPQLEIVLQTDFLDTQGGARTDAEVGQTDGKRPLVL